MQEPALRLVVPESDSGHGQVPPWRAARPATGPTAAPGGGATGPATPPATSGPAEEGTGPATAEPETATADTASDPVAAPATLPAVPAAEPAEAPADDAPARAAGPRPVLQLPGRPMTTGEKAGRLARHWLTAAREDAMRPGELLHAVYHGRPESLAEIHAYALSRAWVPDDYEGSLVPALGAAYSHTIAKGGAALGGSIAWVTARALRLAVFLLVCGVLAVLIIVFS